MVDDEHPVSENNRRFHSVSAGQTDVNRGLPAALRHNALPALLVLLGLVYLAASLAYLHDNRSSTFQSQGITNPVDTIRLGGPVSVEYVMPATVRRIEDLVVFATQASYQSNQGRTLELTIEGGGPLQRSAVIGRAGPSYTEFAGDRVDPAGLAFDSLNVQRRRESDDLVLRLSMPDAAPGTGLALLVYDQVDNGPAPRLAVGPRVRAGKTLGIQSRQGNSSRLWRLVLLGGVLIAACMVLLSNRPVVVPASLAVALPMAWVLSEICWQARLDQYWNFFWPDGYVAFAHQIRSWMAGDTDWAQLREFMSHFRNGSSWFAPLFVAVLARFGSSYLWAFTVFDLVAFSALLLAWVGLFRALHPGARAVDQVLVALVVAFHSLHLLTGTTPMTDIGASALSAVFFFFFNRLVEGGGRPWPLALLCALLIYLACHTRLAMLPLVLVPAALALLRALAVRPEGATSAATGLVGNHLVAAPTWIAALALLLTYQGLDLYGTFSTSFAVATDAKFTSAFSAGEFIDHTLDNCLPAVVLALVYRRHLGKHPIFMGVWLFVAGYLAMLALGQIITWERYWTPLAGPGVFLALAAAAFGTDARSFRLVAVLMLGFQVYMLFHHDLGVL